MALLASRIEILTWMHWPQPERVIPVRPLYACNRHPVAAVAWRAAKFLGIVNLEQLFIRMAGERAFSAHCGLGDHHWLACPHVAGLAPVHQIHILNMDLPDANILRVHR